MSNHCYNACNSKFNAWDPKRIFCKKGCDSDEDSLQIDSLFPNQHHKYKCKNETCSSLCIRSELGEDDSKLGSKQHNQFNTNQNGVLSFQEHLQTHKIVQMHVFKNYKGRLIIFYKQLQKGCNNKTDFDGDD